MSSNTAKKKDLQPASTLRGQVLDSFPAWAEAILRKAVGFYQQLNTER